MPPVFRSLLIEENGAIYGVPESITLENELYWIPAIWKEFGFSPSMIPDSFETLLDILEYYLETPHDAYCVFYYTCNPNAQYTDPELHISIGNEVSDLYNLTALRRAVYY